ncbi:hypothetical protein F4801DRAFT_565610 [Xylaria longipes]|nr:hypothetical protein F4801DRAFT_565610 [Xylaria longipes]
MNECQTRHKLCSLSFFNSGPRAELPTRLIDISSKSQDKKPIIRLITTRTLEIRAPYVALSYCWGKSMQSSSCLRESNLQDLHSCIDEKELPKTHRDTFQLARDLGFRYVWIDALCIVQGNSEDWEGVRVSPRRIRSYKIEGNLLPRILIKMGQRPQLEYLIRSKGFEDKNNEWTSSTHSASNVSYC